MRKVVATINMALDGFCDHTVLLPDEELSVGRIERVVWAVGRIVVRDRDRRGARHLDRGSECVADDQFKGFGSLRERVVDDRDPDLLARLIRRKAYRSEGGGEITLFACFAGGCDSGCAGCDECVLMRRVFKGSRTARVAASHDRNGGKTGIFVDRDRS